jgi:phosphatidylglycerol:prolipoprotein diacylglycerol transferase
MLPILFTIGPVTIYTFGFLLGLGFFLTSFIIWRRLRELGLKEEKIIDGIIFGAFLGFFFSRIFFVIQNFSDFGISFGHWILVGRYPGFSFWGALVGILLGLIWFCRQQKWDFWRVADEVTLGILPFFFLAQLGAFFDGTSPGKPTSMPWGIFFPGSLVRQHPVSLFSAIFLFLIWVFLLKIERQWRTWSWYKSQAPGFITLTSFSLIFLTNFPLAFLRETRLYFYWLEIILSLFGVAVSLILIWQKRK